MDDKPLTGKESLQLITDMISRAKNDYEDTGIAALMWGSIIIFCSLVTFGNYWWNIRWLNNVWWLPAIAIVPQIIVSARERKKRKIKTYYDNALGGIWLSFAISLFLLSYYTSLYNIPNTNPLFIIIYGIPTFASGYARRFTPMIIGGVACWVLAIAAMYVSFPYVWLLTAAAAQLAWFIPGLMLRSRFRKAKEQHV